VRVTVHGRAFGYWDGLIAPRLLWVAATPAEAVEAIEKVPGTFSAAEKVPGTFSS